MANPSVLIVANPRSHGVRRSGLLERFDRLRASGRAALLLTAAGDHARRYCRESGADFERILVAGGDGLLNEVADGSFGHGVALAPIPAGSGNDYVKALPGYPASLEALLEADQSMPADMGRVTFADATARHFLSEAGSGMDAACVRLMPQWLNRLNPAMSYNVGSIRAILSYRPYGTTVTLDEQTHRFERVHMLAVANTTYFGDGMPLAPDARFDDGRFHVVVVKDASRLELLLKFKMIRLGTHVTHPDILYRPCRVVTVQADRELEMCIDGDYVPKTPARFENLPGAARILRPAAQQAD